MPFLFVDLVVGGLSATFTFCVAILATWFVGSSIALPVTYAGIILLIVFIFILVLVTGLYGRVVAVFWPLRPGTYSLAEPLAQSVVWKLQGFMNMFNSSLLVHTYLLPVNMRWALYRLLGAKVGKNVIMAGKVLEPFMIEIGDYTMLGEDSLVTGHTIEGHHVTLGRIKIGNHVTVGVKAVIFPNVEIGDHALVAAGALVKKGTRVGPGEIWGGVPAKKLAVKSDFDVSQEQ